MGTLSARVPVLALFNLPFFPSPLIFPLFPPPCKNTPFSPFFRELPCKIHNVPRKTRSERIVLYTVQSTIKRHLAISFHSSSVPFYSAFSQLPAFIERSHLKLCSNYLAVDATMRSQIRLTCQSAVWTVTCLKTSEEASGITGFVRCVAAGNTDSWTSLDTSTNAQIHQCCLYWQHPHLPWLHLYPRNTVSSVSSSSQSCTIGLDEKIAQTLANDWCESLRSLFGLLRARQCPFFYVCCPQFTILFRAAGIGGINETHALLTPSTKGLRENLNSEDIVFSMPLQRKKTSDSLNDDASHSESETEDEIEDDWIKNIEIQPNLRLQLEAERRKDGGQSTTLGSGSDSLLLVQGVETQGLFNWLLSTKICTPSSGPLVGIPPTLIAPVAFHNATLRPLKTRQAVVKQDGQSMFSLELLGPILPSSFSSLCQLFGSMDFTVTAATLSGTEPFTRVRTEDPSACVTSAFNKESLSDCGLEPQVLEIFCAAQVSPWFLNSDTPQDDISGIF
nr:EOG090X09DI [Eulimnadia texana]